MLRADAAESLICSAAAGGHRLHTHLQVVLPNGLTMSEESFHQIDPNGDVVLILRNPDAPFAVWEADLSSEENEELKAMRDTPSSFDDAVPVDVAAPYEEPLYYEPEPEPEAYSAPEPETEAYHEPEPELGAYVAPEPEVRDDPAVKYLVSSKHLALASRCFSAKLSGPWIEASVKHIDGCYHMDASDWDPEALLILMHVIHGKTRSVPRQIDLEMLAKLAVLVDYYDCHEVIELYCSELPLSAVAQRFAIQVKACVHTS
ncbi:hypothetical protein CSAL01_06126 [Colletotrichum salicis]|uniref:BTB domain-containing protein n=1 Tax=Colletotrichum salicis TaxID=1209931 RepID=A0A135U8Z7_9PEZI|nr:hypothetical protein CSAL01_06126 [Colletotrichum salicis]